jgi:hypothetical protein
MKNKGRKHKSTNFNLKGLYSGSTRPVKSMCKTTNDSWIGKNKKHFKRNSMKKVRTYFKNYNHITDIEFDSNY